MIAKSRRRESRSRGLDPFAIEPTALSGNELAWLAERWPLDPAADGPLAFLLSAPRHLDDDERRCAENGLRAKGLLRHRQEVIPIWELDRTVARGSLLRRSLTILERPEARIRIGLHQAHCPPRQVHLYVAGEEAALGLREGECFFVGPPIATVALAMALFRHLDSEPLPGVRGAAAAGLWPFVLDLLVALWPAGSPQPLRALPRSSALAALHGADDSDPERAQALLDGLLTAGIVRQERGGLALDPGYRPWVEALLSSDRVEVEYTPLASAAAGEAGEAGEADRLLFVGPAGSRVLCGYLDRSLLELEGGFEGLGSLGDGWPEEQGEQFLFMTHLAERPLAIGLRELLRL